MQYPEVYTDSETSSPTIALSVVYMVAAIAAREGRHVCTMDIGGAYIHANLEKEVLMNPEPASAKILCQLDPTYLEQLGKNVSITVRLRAARVIETMV
jgi:hypothetical protein